MIATAPVDETSLEAPTLLLRACADPARLRILNLIRHGGEVCNCQIGPVTGYIPSKISRHLALLRQAGLLRERRDGTFIHYSLTKPTAPQVKQLIRWIDLIAAEDPVLQADRAQLDADCVCD